MVDELHQRPEGAARHAFNRHKIHLIEDEDFFIVPHDEWSKIPAVYNLHGSQSRNNRTFLTQNGYLLLVKSFNDDLAWKVQRQLVNAYFKKQSETKSSNAIDNKYIEWMLRQLRYLKEVKRDLTRSEIASFQRGILKDLPVSQETEAETETQKGILIAAIEGLNGRSFSPLDIAGKSGLDARYCRKMLHSWNNKSRYVSKIQRGLYKAKGV